VEIFKPRPNDGLFFHTNDLSPLQIVTTECNELVWLPAALRTLTVSFRSCFFAMLTPVANKETLLLLVNKPTRGQQ